MFKKFNVEETVSSTTQLKSSAQRHIKKGVLQQYPELAKYADDILPPKVLREAKCPGKITIVVVNQQPLFFGNRGREFYPTLKLLHQYPFMMPTVQVDKGAIRFVLSGANIMCPGLTSAGAKMDTDLPVGTPVAIMAEGKKHALAIGVLTMSTEDIRSVNKGVGVEVKHFLDDGLWRADTIA